MHQSCIRLRTICLYSGKGIAYVPLSYGSALSPSTCPPPPPPRPFASFLYVKRVDLYSETDQVGLHTQFISRGEAHGNYLSLLCGRADGGKLCASHTERIPCNKQRDVVVFCTALTCCNLKWTKVFLFQF